MKRTAKPVFFIVFVIILALAYTAIFGVYGENGDFRVTYIKGINDIRWGIDINGGVEVSFSPKDTDATKEEMESVKAILELRMVALNITDYEIYPDYDNDTIMVRFPRQNSGASLYSGRPHRCRNQKAAVQRPA